MINEFLDYNEFAIKHNLKANDFNTLKLYIQSLQGVCNA